MDDGLRAFLMCVPAYASAAIVAAIAWRVWPFFRDRATLASGASAARVRETTLDAMRGLLCIGVLVSHAGLTLRLPQTDGRWLSAFAMLPLTLVSQGELAVALFFATTAFLFYDRAVATRGSATVRAFLIGRLARIAPAYGVSAVAVAVIAFAAASKIWLSPPAAARLLGSLPFLGAVPWPTDYREALLHYNAGVQWTLVHEWTFYGCFPAILYLCRGDAPVAVRLLVAFAAASWASGGVGLTSPPMMFVGGMVAVHLRDVPRVARFARSPLGSFGAVAITAATLLGGIHVISWQGQLLATALFTLVASGADAFGLLRLRSLQTLGVASYSVYLFHGLFLFALRPWLFIRATPAATTFAEWWPIDLIAAGVTLVALVSFRWIEYPGIALGRRLASGPRDATNDQPTTAALPLSETASAP